MDDEYFSRPVTAFDMVSQPTTDPNFANTMYDRLVTQAIEYEELLGHDEEIGVLLAHFGRELKLRLIDFGFHNPSLIIVHAEELDGTRVRLVQHTHQVNLLFLSLRVAPGREPHRIAAEQEESSDELVGDEPLEK